MRAAAPRGPAPRRRPGSDGRRGAPIPEAASRGGAPGDRRARATRCRHPPSPSAGTNRRPRTYTYRVGLQTAGARADSNARATGTRATRVIGVLSLVGVPLVLLLGLVTSPEDVEMGDSVRIMYVHVPSAWLAYLAFGVTAVCSALYLWPRTRTLTLDRFAGASAEIGVLFTGRSGIGKSECVLDLVERGHRLVADDLVICSRRGNDVLIGRGHELQRHFMEIRGVGLIDVPAIFGIRAVRRQKRIEVVVHLDEWSEHAVSDRTGLDGQTTTILGVDLPIVTVYVNPGKNITVIAEVIAMNHLLKYTGVDAAEAFNTWLMGKLRQAADARHYLVEDDE